MSKRTSALNAETQAALTPDGVLAELMDGNKTSYGIGWAIREKNNQKFLGHTGGSVGGTTFVFSSESGHVVSLMANLSNASFGDLPFEIFKIFNN